ncbi:serine protease grass-like [Drosophila bipectinata]|uniref:serine protease grass-like n=1 Tax=Drosophila bipectinata TaxID=42026 RepID=UPI0038B3B5C1
MLGLRFSILAICLVLSLQWIGPVDSKICQTHDNKTGTCQRVRDCPALKSISDKLINKIPLTNKEEILRNCVLPCEKQYTLCCEESLNPDGLKLLKENESICGSFGEPKDRTKYRPWTALLEYYDDLQHGRRFYCGGTLITSKFVLTAAQCIKDNLVSVRLGEFALGKTPDCLLLGNHTRCLDRPVDVPIEKVFVHEGFEENIKNVRVSNNIALIRLKDPVQFNDLIGPICLPVSPDLQLESQTVKSLDVFGWDLMMQLNGYIPRWPLYELLESTACNIQDEKKICIRNSESYRYRGDVGGALVYPSQYNGRQLLVQAGIVSVDIVERSDRSLTEGTDVSDFMGWITETIAKKD